MPPPVVPHAAPVADADAIAVWEAVRRFAACGIVVGPYEGGRWRIRRAARGGDRIVGGGELVLLARSLRPPPDADDADDAPGGMK